MLSIKLTSGAKLPRRATIYDAGYDLCSVNPHIISAGETQVLDTGVHIKMPNPQDTGLNPDQYIFYGRITGRSSLAKRGLMVYPGTVDFGYQDEIGVVVKNLSTSSIQINQGDKIAQLLVVPCFIGPVIQVDELDGLDNNDRIGGFGSTGR